MKSRRRERGGNVKTKEDREKIKGKNYVSKRVG
jgi:hypothetical protein